MKRTRKTPGGFGSSLEEAYVRLGARGRGILLAVSGGADSLGLLAATVDLKERLDLRIEVATLDHGLRAESAAEARGVAELCEGWGIPCHVRKLALKAGAGLEARARDARYEALERLRAERGLELIATAHTADDQAETVLMRLARGASLQGAAGILEARERVVRPLLSCTRSQALAELSARGLVPVEDPMNADPRFARVAVRREVLPALTRAMRGDVVRPLADFARYAKEDAAALAEIAEGAWAGVCLGPGLLSRERLLACAPAIRRRLLARLLEEQGLLPRAGTLQSAERAAASGGRGALSREAWVDAQGGVVRVGRRVDAVAAAPVEIGAEWSDVGWAGLAVRRAGEVPGDVEPGLALALEASSGPPFLVRPRRPGDRVRVGGHTRKLQDLLVDLRVPVELRGRLPVVTGGEGGVIWLPGIWAPRRPPAGGHLLARSITGGQAPEWLVRYRLVKSAG